MLVNDAKQGVMSGWLLGIGDLTFGGWLTVGAYLGAALLCWRAGRLGMMSTGRLNVWHMLTLALIVFAISRQFDLRSLLSAAGRHVAHQDGWYGERRKYQASFIITLIALSLCSIAIFFFALRRSHTRERIAVLGAAILTTVVVIQATSFHHADLMLRMTLAGVKLSNLLELGCIALIAIPAATAPSVSTLIARRRRAKHRRGSRSSR